MGLIALTKARVVYDSLKNQGLLFFIHIQREFQTKNSRVYQWPKNFYFIKHSKWELFAEIFKLFSHQFQQIEMWINSKIDFSCINLHQIFVGILNSHQVNNWPCIYENKYFFFAHSIELFFAMKTKNVKINNRFAGESRIQNSGWCLLYFFLCFFAHGLASRSCCRRFFSTNKWKWSAR